jgi:hypothetical protein
MQPPFRNIARGLRAQSSPGRKQDQVVVERQSAPGPLIWSGDAETMSPPGAPFPNDTVRYANILDKLFGGNGGR